MTHAYAIDSIVTGKHVTHSHCSKERKREKGTKQERQKERKKERQGKRKQERLESKEKVKSRRLTS